MIQTHKRNNYDAEVENKRRSLERWLGKPEA